MRSVYRLARLRTSYGLCHLSVPSPVENRTLHTENRSLHTENRTSSLPRRTSPNQHYRNYTSESVPEERQRSVKVAIVGSPNVGKSTLLNSLMQQYISPVSKLRNTTWGNVLGVITQDETQVIFIDTPGLLPGEFREKRGQTAMKEFYRKSLATIRESLQEADVALFMFDCSLSLYKLYITADMEDIIESIPDTPKILVLNKIDKAREKEKIECIVDQLTKPRPPVPVPSISVRSDIHPRYLHLQYEDEFRDGAEFDEVVTLSALQGQHVNYLWYKVRQLAVHRPWDYSPDVVSPDGIEDVVTSIVRAEILKKSGYFQAYKLDHKFIGYKEEGDKLIIEFAIFRRLSIFKSEENQADSVDYIQNVLSVRYGCPVEFRLLERRYSQPKSHLLDILDLSEEPDIDVLDESE